MSDPDLNKNVCFWDNNVSKKDEEEEEESAQRQRLETDLGFMHLACSSPSDGTKVNDSQGMCVGTLVALAVEVNSWTSIYNSDNWFTAPPGIGC